MPRNNSVMFSSVVVISLIALVAFGFSSHKVHMLKNTYTSLRAKYPGATVYNPVKNEFLVVDYIHKFTKRILVDSKGNMTVEDQKETK